MLEKIKSIQLNQEPAGSFQGDVVYPQKIIGSNTVQVLLNKQMVPFLAYSGQGKIYLWSTNYQKYAVFINGIKLKLTNLAVKVWYKLDISAFTINGDNRLQVTSQAEENNQSSLRIKIPYPVLQDHLQSGNDTFKLIDCLIDNEIKEGFPSAQLVVVHNGQVIKQNAYGRINSYTRTGERRFDTPKVTDSTLYDLASNTKMWATNMALQKLVSEKKLQVDLKINKIFPQFKDQPEAKIKGKTELTIRDLLEHQAGFPADPQYFDNNYVEENSSKSGNEYNSLYTHERQQILIKIIETPLDYVPGTKTIYSDVDYMLLGLVIEEITGEREDQYVEDNIYRPLNLQSILYNPLQQGFSKQQIAATELDGNTFAGTKSFNNIRTETIQGEVHDSKAYYTMAGVSGHAGLFGTAKELAVLAQLVLNYGGYDNKKIFDYDTLIEFVKPKFSDPTYGLGWRRQAAGDYQRIFSNLASPDTVGHTGWTGTLTLVDFSQQTIIIWLTNKCNTPVLNGKNQEFAGNHYLLGKYGDIVSLVYSAIANDDSEANDQKLIGMVQIRYQQVKNLAGAAALYDKKDLRALYATLLSRKQNSGSITKFLNSNTGKKITAFLDKKHE